ncbi:MAG TPA: response regulator, partial [Kofleriaceae bacterium]
MSKTILCADDSATMQKVAEVTFGGSEYKYVGARSADEALKVARSERPALILADAIMPGKTGYDLCKAIKSDPDLASIPVLLMCGNSQAYDNARGEQCGADGHVVKPW